MLCRKSARLPARVPGSESRSPVSVDGGRPSVACVTAYISATYVDEKKLRVTKRVSTADALWRMHTHSIGNQPPQANAWTLQISQIGSGSVRYVCQICLTLSNIGLLCHLLQNCILAISARAGWSVSPGRSSCSCNSSAEGSRMRSSTAKTVIACVIASDRLAKTDRILICSLPRNPNVGTRSTLPTQNPSIEPTATLH